MKNNYVIQDYLFSSALAFKTIALFITLYALYVYAPVVLERNPVTRLLHRNDLVFFLAEMSMIAFMCFGYSMVRKKYVVTRELRAMRLGYAIRYDRVIRSSFNALVAFVFLTSLWDAANDAIILLTTPFPGVHG